MLVGSLVPLAYLGLDALNGRLGANPIERVLHQTGLLALILLVASLACTPLRLLAGWTWPARIRKLLGLLAFAYALLHFAVYVVLDRNLRVAGVLEDVVKRPFITVGFAAVVILVPLAITSTKGAVRRMGYRAWDRLHRLAYLAAILAAIHFYWSVKKDVREPLRYALVLAVLLLVRLAWNSRRRKRSQPAASTR